MRKIKSKYEEKRKQKRNNYILGIILIVVLFGSVFGIIVNSFGKKDSSSKIEYKGVAFLKQDSLWYASIGNFNFVFQNNPLEINDTQITDIKSLESYKGKVLYIYSENYNSKLEIFRNMKNVAERMQSACVDKETCDGDYPVKDCSNNFIIIQESNETSITQKDGCVYIKGSENELVGLTDEFLFKTIGIK